MSIYTYVVDHGEHNPSVSAGTEVNGGKVIAVQFDDALAQIEELEDRLRAIGDFAHEHSTGPAAPDAMWEVRSMTYGT